eukprot:s3393_g6.t1
MLVQGGVPVQLYLLGWTYGKRLGRLGKLHGIAVACVAALRQRREEKNGLHDVGMRLLLHFIKNFVLVQTSVRLPA